MNDKKLFLGHYDSLKIYRDNTCSNNLHILVTGETGTGKSTALIHLAKELAKTGAEIYIPDYSGYFTTSNLGIRESILEHPAISQPFKGHQKDEEAPVVLLRYAEMLADIWHLGPNQYALVVSALMEMSDMNYETLNFQNPFARYLRFSESQLCYDIGLLSYCLVEIDEKEGKRLAERFLDILILQKPYQKTLSLQDSNIKTLTYPAINGTLISRLTNMFLYSIFMKHAYQKNTATTYIILDEIQNLNWALNSVLVKLLKEGRKFNINLILATQTLTDEFSKPILNAILQADLHLIFNPPASDYRLINKIICDTRYNDSKPCLPTGFCLASGYLCADHTNTYRQCVKIQIPSEVNENV